MQAIIFDNSIYSPKEARDWLKEHDYSPIKPVHRTRTLLRYRLRQPKKGEKYRIINLSKDGSVRGVYIISGQQHR